MASTSSHNRSSTSSLDQTIPGAFPDATEAKKAFSSQQSLQQALYSRRHEYTRLKKIRIKVGSWNVAAMKGTEKDIGGWFVEGKGITEDLAGLAVTSPTETRRGNVSVPDSGPLDDRESVEAQEARRIKSKSTLPKNDPGSLPGGDEVGLYVMGLQEVVDVSSATEALRPYTDPGSSKKYRDAIEEALPKGYILVAEQQLIGLLLLVYAAPDIAQDVKSVSTTSVGTGLMGYMGNKGAVTARLVLGETTRLVFINSHLGAGADQASLDRRNWDAGQVVSRTRFDPITDVMGITQSSGEMIGDEDFAFWFGDLNYRLQDMPGDDVRRLLMLHTRNEYDIGQYKANKIDEDISQPTTSSMSTSSDFAGNDAAGSSDVSHSASKSQQWIEDTLPPASDPTSLQTTLSSLLPHDELHQQMKERKAFHDGWKEGHVRFMPTYKYDVGSVGIFDSSEKKRCPSWCDRILYRTRRDKLAYDERIKDEEESKRRDEEMKKNGVDKAGEDEDVLFDYDPDADGENDYDDYNDFASYSESQTVVTKEGFEDEVEIEYYTSHQRVLSSDHKPLAAIFVLQYDAIIPELKAQVHQEVARELDRAENEGRPTITLIIDRGSDSCSQSDGNFEGVDFGHVRYAQSKRRSLTVANTGQVPATISFIDRSISEGQQSGPAPPWLSIRFDRDADAKSSTNHSAYTLEPGDACNVVLVLRVQLMELVKNLNAQTANLEDILVLRVNSGRDHFCPVRAHWLQSSFGRSIDKLIRLPEGGIRRLQHQRPDSKGSSTTNSPAPAFYHSGVKISAPRELFRLTQAIEDLVERSVAEWEMVHDDERPPWEGNAGWPFVEESRTRHESDDFQNLLTEIYDALDCDRSFDGAFGAQVPTYQRVEVLAATLLTFLKSLEDGIVTQEAWSKLDAEMAERERSKRRLDSEDEKASVLEALFTTPNHNVSFILLTSMLVRVITEIVGSIKPVQAGKKAIGLPVSPKASLRRRTLSEDPTVARRHLMEKNYAAVLASAMIRSGDVGLKEKEKRASEDRKRRVIETFLKES